MFGEILTIFVTGTPEACHPCEPQNVIMKKPVDGKRLIENFKALLLDQPKSGSFQGTYLPWLASIGQAAVAGNSMIKG